MHIGALAFAAVLALTVAPPVSAQIMEMNGTWEMIPDKCLSSSPAGEPSQETLVFKSVEGIQRYTATWIVNGVSGGYTWEAQYDGRDRATSGELADTASIRRLGEKSELVVN